MNTDTKTQTPIDLDDFGEFIKSLGITQNLYSRIMNTFHRRTYTEEFILEINFDDVRIWSWIPGLSRDTVLKFIRPYQQVLIKKHDELARKRRNEIIKTKLNGDLEIFKNPEAIRTVLEIHHSKFITEFLSKLPEYDRQYTNTQCDILVILDKYRDRLLGVIDDLSNYKEE